MPVGIGGAGSVGIAHEVTPGTYVAPTRFLPVRSESMQFINEVQYTRPIMQVVDNVHAVEGPQRVEGDIEFELIEDIFTFLMYGARMSVAKSGSSPNFTYTFTPSMTAEHANKTLSLTIVRNDVIFGYTGCVIGSIEISVDSGLAICTMSLLGRGETTQANPTEAFPVTEPFGADAYTIEIPSGSPVTDTDTLTWSVDESAEAVYRLGQAQAAAFVKYGERSITASVERDFINKTDYDGFKAVTAQALRFLISKTASRSVDILTRSAIKSSYEVNLSGQGDLVRGSIEYEGKYDFANSESFRIITKTDIDIT